jgi:hypothetical protein
MTMPYRMRKRFPVLTAILAFAFLSSTALGQTPGSRTTLAAKQHLKNEVLDAMADGKITNVERADILAEAKEVLTAKEYLGLIATMDRLSPAEKNVATVKHPAKAHTTAIATATPPETPSFLGRMVSAVPYVDEISIGPRPKVSDIAKSVPYFKPSPIELSGAQQALAKTSRLKDTYIEQPTANRPLLRITHLDKAAAPIRAVSKQSPSRGNKDIEKQSQQPKYTDNSIAPPSVTPTTSKQSALQQPAGVEEELNPVAVSREPATLATPAGALLPESRISSANAGYTKLMQPEQIDLEFMR